MSESAYTPLDEQFAQEREAGRRDAEAAAAARRKRVVPRERPAARGDASVTREVFNPSRTFAVSPSKSQARKMVLVSIFLLGVIAVYREKQGQAGSLYKRLWGIGVIGVVLSLAADFVPTIAGPFAVLMVLGSLTSGGDKAIQNVLASVSTKIPSKQ